MILQNIICYIRTSKAKGYILTDVVFSLSVVVCLGIMCSFTGSRCLQNMCYLQEQAVILDSGRNIVSILEKNLGYNARKITITADKTVKYNSIQGSKNIILYLKGKTLYQKTITGKGSGINPVSLEHIAVENWQVLPQSSNLILLKITLRYGKCTKEFCRLIRCCNAVIEND